MSSQRVPEGAVEVLAEALFDRDELEHYVWEDGAGILLSDADRDSYRVDARKLFEAVARFIRSEEREKVREALKTTAAKRLLSGAWHFLVIDDGEGADEMINEFFASLDPQEPKDQEFREPEPDLLWGGRGPGGWRRGVMEHDDPRVFPPDPMPPLSPGLQRGLVKERDALAVECVQLKAHLDSLIKSLEEEIADWHKIGEDHRVHPFIAQQRRICSNRLAKLIEEHRA